MSNSQKTLLVRIFALVCAFCFIFFLVFAIKTLSTNDKASQRQIANVTTTVNVMTQSRSLGRVKIAQALCLERSSEHQWFVDLYNVEAKYKSNDHSPYEQGLLKAFRDRTARDGNNFTLKKCVDDFIASLPPLPTPEPMDTP